MAETKKVRLRESRGNPTVGGAVIRAGTVIEIAAYWADKWISEGVAEPVETGTDALAAKPKAKKGK